MATGISQSVATQLSGAAYTPIFDYRSGINPPLPSGWEVDLEYSGSIGQSQFLVFVNRDAQQVVLPSRGPISIPANLWLNSSRTWGMTAIRFGRNLHQLLRIV